MKRALALLYLLMTTTLVNGQVLKSIGIKGGISISNQTWEYKIINPIIETKNRGGIYCALTLELFQSKYLSLITDIGYCEKGNKQDVLMTTPNLPESETNKTFDTKFNYLEFAPMLKVRSEVANLIPYALLGVRLDYQLSYKSDFDFTNIENEFHKTIYGLTTGAGVEYKIEYIGIIAEFQYHYDINKVLDNESLEAKNKAFIISVGIKYYLHKKERAK